MMESLLRASVCVAVALLAADWCAHAAGLAEDCGRYASCGECHAGSAACDWCSTASLPTARCVSLTAPLDPSVSCAPCEERSRSAREVGTCDDTACLGVGDHTCSGHGTCECSTCTCEPGYTGRACQNCPSKWDDCPGSDGSSSTCCSNIMHQCLGWPSKCARCMRSERNATLCDICPRDTSIVTSDPGLPQSAECVFDSLSFSSNLHCSYHVYYWRDEAALALHARVQLDCGSAADKTIFPKRNEPAESVPAGPLPTPAPAATAPPRAATEPAPEKTAEAEITEKPEGAAKPSSAAAGAALSQATVIMCGIWTRWGLI